MSKYWKTKDGKIIKLEDMSIQHLIRALKYLERKVTIERLKGSENTSVSFRAVRQVQHELEDELERRNRESFNKDCKFM